MRLLIKLLLLFALIACAGCTRASGDARIDHILAGPHGWIDIVLHTPKLIVAEGAASAVGLPSCSVQFETNGETRLSEGADLVQADAAGTPIGYRFAVPAGALKTELHLSGCTDELDVSLPVKLDKDQLALIEYDGSKLVLKATQPYVPTSLDGLHGEIATLQQRADGSDTTLSTLTKLAIASVLLNAVVIALVLARRRG